MSINPDPQQPSARPERNQLKRLRRVLRQLDEMERSERMDEAAIPAYSHRNPVIAHVFWKRLQVVSNLVAAIGRVPNALDVGCGSGVMLPQLAQTAERVVAIDPDLTACRRFATLVPLAASVSLVETPLETFVPDGGAETFALIIALDSLEHIKDLPAALKTLDKLLAPGGTLIVSGPTESQIYRLGRKIAGKRFSGHYHERGVAEIRDLMAEQWQIASVRRLPRLLPLFEVISARKL